MLVRFLTRLVWEAFFTIIGLLVLFMVLNNVLASSGLLDIFSGLGIDLNPIDLLFHPDKVINAQIDQIFNF